MTKIVTRLRLLENSTRHGPERTTINDAANELERLREALKQITEVRYYGPQGPDKESHEMHEIANRALKGGE
jgi:hypothetical protein